jgi:lipoprotein signal peptidase
VDPSPENATFIVTPAAVGAATFVLAFGLDLLSKVIVVAGDHGHLVVYNARAPAFTQRVAMSLVAILVTYLLSRGAAHTGIGRLWGAWIGAGLLVGGVLGNGVSPFIWSRGVPDFINMHAFVWNYADFEISIGLTGGLLSVAVAALAAYLRDRRLPPVAPVAD